MEQRPSGRASQRRTPPSGARRAPRGRAATGARLQLAPVTTRLRWLLLIILVVLTLFMGRALQLQAFDSQAYAAKAAAQMTHTVPLVPQRGRIADRFGTVMADTVPAVKIIADPSMIERNGADKRRELTEREQAIGKAAPGAMAAVLAKHLGGKPADFLPALTARDKAGKPLQYKVVAPQVEASTWNEINKELRKGGPAGKYEAGYWYGLYKEDNPKRIYPSGSVGGNLVGVVRSDGTALTGLEKHLDDQLTGTPGVETFESSVYGRIPLGTDVLTPAVDGTNYNLTIDTTLQQTTEAALAKGTINSAAATGTAIVMNVKTGEVLANANLPGYDPNNISRIAAKNSMLNRSVEAIYEPGSVQKVLTMAALADKGLVTADTRVEVPPKLASGSGYIRDSYAHGTVPMTARGVMAKSSNIGTTMLARQLDKATTVEYLKSFGLGRKTGLELPGEGAGLLPKADMADYTRDQIAFGQGLSTTPIQEAAAVAGIVNDGVYNPPTLLKQATSSTGEEVELPDRTPRRVISKQASAEVRDMMEAVITLAPEDRAIPGYRTIGKSGTAERADGKGGYSGYTASFVMAAPAENPQILVYVVLDEPIKGHQGSEVALPVAQEVMKLALPRYGVLPDSTPAPEKPLEYEP
ncbi:peptidoglycan D,D-transpeptidase FtsI family protein [Luteococcus sp. OSA5]|uniref:peptidoglycan D,D-transpeptidase FtsI family protein n=1 Tax=Luteococcus sp. OSA5 TaxID=3401630 RepID=UPI003B43A932